ncbi:sulfite exporter TauE/SafE family protein [Ignatzschineria rhizosphaerae]|uniref:Probable membrane transporter protein n=1 Tax=Ignatzschineria rhizosphaerae TaxID=2923279 RepID=A0ABY3X1Y6_9GAMM|nr:sulfite exporter TauE/SafE family protein [Ignatzschineria rhizosphaerae]UNM95477.1 sulfite exporter TauE/SafE family protein [Ignatzschineria rhizosphaerae]
MGIELVIFLLLGCIIGLISGLLGVGGGTVVVPALVFFLVSQGVDPELIMKVALGTSFAVVGITSLSSVIAHQKRGSVVWTVVFLMGVGAIIGVAIGSRVVSMMNNFVLQLFFCLFLAYTIINMLRTASKKEADKVSGVPKPIYLGAGGIIGFISSFVGIGGGVMIVPVLSKIGYQMKNAIASSSAIGMFMAAAGATSAVINGWGVANVPENSIGFVYYPAVIGLSLTSVIFAPIGAKLVYILPVKRIRQILAGFLTIILIVFIYNNFV